LLLFSTCIVAQEEIKIQDKYTAHNKGKIFCVLGGKRGLQQTLLFKGNNYNFTLENAAQDKPKGWHIDYINLLE
jgi:hypothetical protein